MKNKIILGSLILTSSTLFLSACTNNEKLPVENKEGNINNQKEIIENKNDSEKENKVFLNTEKLETKLSISDKCIGCGKCSRIDPEHFKTLNPRQKPTIISQQNLKSTSLITAISICPTSAININ